MRLKPRVDELERKISPQPPQRWITVIQDGQTEEEAIAAYEAEHGPVGDANVMMVVIV